MSNTTKKDKKIGLLLSEMETSFLELAANFEEKKEYEENEKVHNALSDISDSILYLKTLKKEYFVI